MFKVLFLASGGGGVPLVGAYANRIMSMAKGLTQNNGVAVTIWFVFLGDHNLSSKRGCYEGVRYEYLVNPEVKYGGLSSRIIHLYGILKATVVLAIKRRDFDIAISFFHGMPALPMWIMAKLLGLPIIRELNEYPTSILSSSHIDYKSLPMMLERSSLSLFTGYIAISQKLRDYLHGMFPRAPIIVVPINVQPERFTNRLKTSERFITYSGAISSNKDGVDTLIKAFVTISNESSNVKLRLIGGFVSEEDEILVRDLIRKNDLENLVSITGWITRDQVAKLIMDSHILVLPRPDSRQAQGGFPTKLGEYLATGIPTIATTVGEIPYYLADGVNAFLCPPNNETALVEAINRILYEYDSALLVAEKGKQLAYNEFNYLKQADIISRFLHSFLRN